MAYTYGDLKTAVQDDLKDSSFSLTRIGRYLNAGQNVIFNTHMFKFCEKLYDGLMESGEYSYYNQTDYQTTIGGTIIGSNGEIFKMDEDTYLKSRDFFDRFPNASATTSGFPSYWTEYGDYIYFDKPAAGNYTWKHRYYRNATEMTLDADVPNTPSSFRELLEFYALFRSEKYRGNHDIAATYKQEFDDGLESMVLRFAEGTQVGPVVQGSSRVRVSEDA